MVALLFDLLLGHSLVDYVMMPEETLIIRPCSVGIYPPVTFYAEPDALVTVPLQVDMMRSEVVPADSLSATLAPVLAVLVPILILKDLQSCHR